MENENKIFGIDLGTTYSCISYMGKEGVPTVCKSSTGDSTTPSVVRFLPDGVSTVVGQAAKDQAILYPEDTIQFVKAKIGRVESFEYGPEGDRKTTTPIAVSAEILKTVAKEASDYCGTEVKNVVITVPAYFGQKERDATKQAGIDAGLNVIDIVEEPTAAAFHYGCQNDGKEVVLVYDLGGGTFDITAIDMDHGSIKVITTEGDHDLGGRLWDETLVDYVKEQFVEQTGYDEEFDADIMQELLIKCETAKRSMTYQDEVDIPVKIDSKNKANIHITRSDFDSMTSVLLQRTIDMTQTVINRVKEKGYSIDKILLVGGSTFMPQVKEAIVSNFNMTPVLNEPNESVSKGAVRYCAWVIANSDGNKGNTTQNEDGTIEYRIPSADKPQSEWDTIDLLPQSDKIFVPVATKSFGIRVIDKKENKLKIRNLLLRDSELPYTITRTFGTAEANMNTVSIALYQSDSFEDLYDEDSGNGEELGNTVLEGLPDGLPEGAPVELTLTMERSGLITVTGKHKDIDLVGRLEFDYSKKE